MYLFFYFDIFFAYFLPIDYIFLQISIFDMNFLYAFLVDILSNIVQLK